MKLSKIPRVALPLLLTCCLAGVASADDVFQTRDHNCRVLQERAQAQGQVQLKTLFNSVTVHASAKACNPDTHYVVSPVWPTADERFCIVGYACNFLFSSFDD